MAQENCVKQIRVPFQVFIATLLRRSYGRTWYNVLFYSVLDTLIEKNLSSAGTGIRGSD